VITASSLGQAAAKIDRDEITDEDDR